jgi:hypothetical protein
VLPLQAAAERALERASFLIASFHEVAELLVTIAGFFFWVRIKSPPKTQNVNSQACTGNHQVVKHICTSFVLRMAPASEERATGLTNFSFKTFSQHLLAVLELEVLELTVSFEYQNRCQQNTDYRRAL